MARFLYYLVDLVLFLLLARVLNHALRFLFGKPRTFFWSSRAQPSPGRPSQTVRGETARDPVCGMFVSTELSHRLSQGGQTLHFCSRECLEKYQRDAVQSRS